MIHSGRTPKPRGDSAIPSGVALGVRVTLAILLVGWATTAHSQEAAPRPVNVPVGTVAENYLRYEQSMGEVPLTAWTIRPLTPPQVDRMHGDTSWSKVLAPEHGRWGNVVWQRLPVAGTLWYNTSYPFGWNDGAVWRGRGATTAIDGGGNIAWKAFSATLNPHAFVAENRAFPTVTPAGTNVSPFSDPQRPGTIDHPQRFGDRSYARLDLGQSTIRVDGFGLTAGVSAANQWLGPMSEWAYTLSDNAPGFPHAFAGSSTPWNIGIGRIHGRVFYGRLGQSPFSNAPDSGQTRVISGFAGSFQPSFLPGLEIGGARTFNYYWPRDGFGWSDVRKPFEGLLKEGLKGNVVDPKNPNQSTDNQIASIYARWVLAPSGIDVYGEYGRNDHAWNGLDLTLEPDHSATYGLGIRKAWRTESGQLRAVRAEMVNFEPSTLARERPAANSGLYSHYLTVQGYTADGQVLGIGFAANEGAGSMIALEKFGSGGDYSSLTLSRLVMRERNAAPNIDVMYAAGIDRQRPMSGWSLIYGLTAVMDINRNFTADVGNAMLTLGVRW
jgi:hypothetical protein